MFDELWRYEAACYPLPVVRGRRNPLHYGLPSRLKKARRQAALTRTALAQRAAVSDTTIRHIETDQRSPTVVTVERLARTLGIAAPWLAYGIGEQQIHGLTASCEGMGERLRTARTERAHNRTDLARLADLTPGAIAKIEIGGQAGIDTVEQLAKALHISPVWLAYGVGPQAAPSRRGARDSLPASSP